MTLTFDILIEGVKVIFFTNTEVWSLNVNFLVLQFEQNVLYLLVKFILAIVIGF